MAPRHRPDWLSLPDELTVDMLSRVGAVELFQNSQFVCKHWSRLVRTRPEVCKIISIKANKYKIRSIESAQKLCSRLVNIGGEFVQSISVQKFGDDNLLKQICHRCPNLLSLRLAVCDSMSVFKRISKLRVLKELELTDCCYTVVDLEGIEVGCKKLETLKLNSEFDGAGIMPIGDADDEEAYAIAEMGNLRHIQLVGNELANAGLVRILLRCQNLISLDLRGCVHVNLESISQELLNNVKSFRPPMDTLSDDEFLQAACAGAEGSDSGESSGSSSSGSASSGSDEIENLMASSGSSGSDETEVEDLMASSGSEEMEVEDLMV